MCGRDPLLFLWPRSGLSFSLAPERPHIIIGPWAWRAPLPTILACQQDSDSHHACDHVGQELTYSCSGLLPLLQTMSDDEEQLVDYEQDDEEQQGPEEEEEEQPSEEEAQPTEQRDSDSEDSPDARPDRFQRQVQRRQAALAQQRQQLGWIHAAIRSGVRLCRGCHHPDCPGARKGERCETPMAEAVCFRCAMSKPPVPQRAASSSCTQVTSAWLCRQMP